MLLLSIDLSVVDSAGPAVGLGVDERGSVAGDVAGNAAVRLDQRLGVSRELDGASPVTATKIKSESHPNKIYEEGDFSIIKTIYKIYCRLQDRFTHWETVGVMSLYSDTKVRISWKTNQSQTNCPSYEIHKHPQRTQGGNINHYNLPTT